MKIAIAGAGAMGCRFGYMLTKAGQDVVLIDEWPAHIEAIRTNGLQVVDGDLATHRAHKRKIEELEASQNHGHNHHH